jgi:hypothetical protein
VSLIACFAVVAPSLLHAGVRWTKPAGSHYVDVPDPAAARGSFVRHGRLFTVSLTSGKFGVSAWDAGSRTWKPWSQMTGEQPVVSGDVNHVTVTGPREVTVFVGVGPAPEGKHVRLYESWSLVIDDASRTLHWTLRTKETRDLSSISNYAAEAETYFKNLNAARLGTPSSPAHIEERYVGSSAIKERAVAFAVGRGLHVYSLPNRTKGLVSPTYERTFHIATGQIGSTVDGWFMVAGLYGGSWPGKAIVWMDEEARPTAVVPLPARFHSYVESAGDAQVIFDGHHEDAWVIAGKEVSRIRWSAPVPYGHLAATADRRWLFLTNGEAVATPVSSTRVSPHAAVGLNVGGRTAIVRPETRTRVTLALAAIAVVVIAIAGFRLRRRSI